MAETDAPIIIRRLAWDEWNREHIRKHRVSQVEIDEVVALEPMQRETYKGRTLLIGQSAKGTMLAVVVGPVPDEPGLYYVFSARPASRQERKRYHSRIKP